MPQAANLVLISYDCARADVALSGRFPGIERLRRRGVTFRNCVSSAPLTPVSHASILTGLQPARHGLRHLFKEPVSAACATLAATLREAGFATSAVVSCPGLNRWYGLDRGFDQYDDEIPLLPDGTDPLTTVDVKLRGQALKRAPAVAARARCMVEVSRAPFFHFMHFFDAHWPYEPPERLFSCPVANAYEAGVAYADHHFSQWLEWFDASPWRDNTLLVLFGDHGEDLDGCYPNDKGGEALGHPEECGHGCLLYDQTTVVPLIFAHPALAPRELAEQVRLVDIMPTCLDLLGRPVPADLDGVSLADVLLGKAPARHLPGFTETMYPREQVEATGGRFDWTRNKRAVRLENRYKVIFHLDSDEVEAYDLLADPWEQRNLLPGRAPPSGIVERAWALSGS